MIIDSLENAAKYEILHPSFKKAFDYLRENDLENLSADFKHEIEGVRFFGFQGKGKTVEESLKTFECHDKNIDIQFCISETETFAWKPRANCKIPNGTYNDEKDVCFFNDAPDMFFKLNKNQFVILFPEDVHAPMITGGMLNKIVIKVEI
ncbi:YhcH/YjgK/YiaL family protein [Flavobacterium fluviatile]|uniref:YhcH/YjgK/YiaL family protein n=1 Tax=Flavobacterium fluviatile TaxID=1862387 RepID=UPI0013D8934D|nr:YhcH/YjgK/YiaL family protein [Flavobacterium fluviatile]